MNRFLIEHDPDSIARSLCDKHIVKMPTEEAQMLCTAVWHHQPSFAEFMGLYKPVHQKHPCTLWAMETRSNYDFAYSLYTSMLCEYHNRYDKWHGAGKHSRALNCARQFIPDGELTPHPQCFSGHDDLKTDEIWPIEAYRNYYRWKYDTTEWCGKYKLREIPRWLIER